MEREKNLRIQLGFEARTFSILVRHLPLILFSIVLKLYILASNIIIAICPLGCAGGEEGEGDDAKYTLEVHACKQNYVYNVH